MSAIAALALRNYAFSVFSEDAQGRVSLSMLYSDLTVVTCSDSSSSTNYVMYSERCTRPDHLDQP